MLQSKYTQSLHKPNQSLVNTAQNKTINLTHGLSPSSLVVLKYFEQECILVGCVPTAAVAATRCQYLGALTVQRGLPIGESAYRGGLCL